MSFPIIPRTDVILNIGLMVGDTEIASYAAFRAMHQLGILWGRSERYDSDTEPTLVVECDATDAQVHELSIMLEQECIAVWDRMHREGRLVGPLKHKWGEFDPEFFLLPNGSRLSEARSLA